ncbi:MAG TPA: hypothetical protein VIL44_07455 [Micromonospora sp.]
MDVALGQELSSAGQRNQCIQIWYVLFTQDLLTGSYFSQAGGITTANVQHPIQAFPIGCQSHHPLYLARSA